MKREQDMSIIKNCQNEEVANEDQTEKVEKPYRKRGNSYL